MAVRSAWTPQSDVLPIVAIAGTLGKSTVAWMLQSIFSASGTRNGSWLSSGVYVDGQPEEGELGPWTRVVLAARHHEIDVAIQEMAASTVSGVGLPAGVYPMVVVTTLCGNNEACLLSPETELERRGIEIVVRSARPDGVLIVNADDYDVVALAEESSARRVLFALHRDNPALQHHLSTGGTGCWIEDGSIVAGDAERAYPVVSVAGIPATLDAAILFQAQNALAATAAALEMGVPSHFVAAGLHAFEPDPDRQPAACNIVRFNGATILVDAPRQLTAMKMVARGIRHQKRRRTIVVSGCFPALSDDEARDAGRILGALGGIIILHGKRLLPERVEIVKSGVASVPVPPIVLTMPDEEHAVDQLLNTLAPDDIGLIMADEPADVLAHLWPAPSISVGSLRRVGVMVRDD